MPENMNDEYVPSQDEQDYGKEAVRVRCSKCANEKITEGTIEQAEKLLVFLGWKLGDKYLCPECVRAKARASVRKFVK